MEIVEEPTNNNNDNDNDNSRCHNDYYNNHYYRPLVTINKTQYACSNCAFTTYSEEKARKHEERSSHRVYARSYRFVRTANSNSKNKNNGKNNNNPTTTTPTPTTLATTTNHDPLTREVETGEAIGAVAVETTATAAVEARTPATASVVEELQLQYVCRKCGFIGGEEEEARKHEHELIMQGHICEKQLHSTLTHPIKRYKEWLKKKQEEEREERSRQARRRKEREYQEFKNQVYEAFSTILARYYNMARSAACFIGQDLNSGSCAWKLPYLYQFLDNEPLLRGQELIITQESLMLAVIPTFPSGRYSNRIEKVHVIAVQVLRNTNDREVEAKYKLIRNVIAERIGKKYEIEAISHIVFALEGENYTPAIERKEIPNYSIVPVPLQSKPLYSNYIKNGRLKHLIVGDCRRTLVFIGKNIYEKILHALSVLCNFYASKAAGMLHDNATTTSKPALKEQIKDRAFQLFHSIVNYGVMDDIYTTREREHAVISSILVRSTFLRLLAFINATKEVMKNYVTKLIRQQNDTIWEKLEHLKALHIQYLRKKGRELQLRFSTKQLLDFLAEEVRLARLLNEEIEKVSKRSRKIHFYWWEVGGGEGGGEGPPSSLSV